MQDREPNADEKTPGTRNAAEALLQIHPAILRSEHCEERLCAAQELLDSFEGPAWSIDRQYRLITANATFRQMFQRFVGRSLAVGDNVLDLPIEASTIAMWHAYYQRVLSGEPLVERTVSTVSPRGRTFEYRMRPLRKASGEIYGAAIFGTDITIKVRNEQALQVNAHILDNLAEGVSLVRDTDGTIAYTNPAFERMFGYGEGELLGQPVSILNAPVAAPPEETAAAIFRQLRDTGQWRGEIQNRRRDGSVFHCHASVTGSHHPEHGAVWISLHQDVTARVRAEAALRESEQRFRAILDHAPMLISAKDLTGRVTLANRHFEVLAGPPPDEFVGQSVFDLFPPKIAHDLWKNDLAALQANTTLESEELVQHRDGSWHTYSTRKFPLLDGRGAAFAVAAISVDVTERLQAEAERAALQSHLMEIQRLESLGVLAGGVAHDINNYLVPILGCATLLPPEFKTHAATLRLFSQMETSARHIRDLVQQMLAYAGKGRLATHGILLDTLAAELLPLLASNISKSCKLLLRSAPDLPSVDGDPAQMRQIVMNLILNASEAMGDRPGEIRITLRAAAQAESGDTAAGAHGVIVEIADDGPGIPVEIRSRIFDPFFSTKTNGRGLGLAAVQGIVRSHHGTIRLQCPPGKGTTFTLYFPSGKLPVQHTQASERVPPLSTQDRCILVVDDEAGVRATVEMMLQHLGYRTLMAARGEEALRRLATQECVIACVLLDLTMPGLSGVDLIRKIRTQYPALPIVVMSGYNAHESLPPDVQSGLGGFLTKPFSLGELRQVLQQIWPCPAPAAA